jgi:hypothetical protein
MRTLVLILLVTQPVIKEYDCGNPIYDEPATCVKICTSQLKKKVWAVKPLSWPVTEQEKEVVPQGRICACYTERVVVIDGVVPTAEMPPEVIK